MSPFGIIMILLGLIPVGIGYKWGLEYPVASPLYSVLIVAYFLAASITTFDTRLIQARWEGKDYGQLPAWTGIFGPVQWGLFCALAVLNWRVAIGLFILKFILKVIPVLETVGNMLMAPLKWKSNSETAAEEDRDAA